MPKDRSLSPQIDPSHAELVDTLCAKLGVRSLSSDQTRFLVDVLADYRSAELPGVTPADLAASLDRFWRLGESFVGSEPQIRIGPAMGEGGRPLQMDILEIVQPDAPFIVDSVMAEVAEWGSDIRAMFHPLLGEGERRRSMIQVWLGPTGPLRRARYAEALRLTLADVHAANSDFPAMLALMAGAVEDLQRAAPGDQASLDEDVAFLRWLGEGHFIYLGARIYEYPRTANGGYAAEEPTYDPAAGLGILRDPGRVVLRRDAEPAVLSVALREGLANASPLVVAKSNHRSRVHRRGYLDYIGVRRYGADGKASGEVRFVGLFTADATDGAAGDTPILRAKINSVIAAAGFPAGSHNAVKLTQILETFPRDELFQVSAEALLPVARDILHLTDRPKVKIFTRRDPFDRFVTVLFYAPRDRYDERLRRAAAGILEAAFRGQVIAFYPAYNDSPLARVYFILTVTPGENRQVDLSAVEAELTRAARTWEDDFEAVVRQEVQDSAQVQRMLKIWSAAFPLGYRDLYDAEEGLRDARQAEELVNEGDVAVRAFRRPGDHARSFHFKLYRRGPEPAPLSAVLPILSHMGLRALSEEGFPVSPGNGHGRSKFWVHEFLVDDEQGERLRFEDIQGPFESAFIAVWSGLAESDGFNRLVLELGISWREAALVRALARYRQQSGLDPSQSVQEAALTAYPTVTRQILKLFAVRFDPASGEPLKVRAAAAAALGEAIEAALRDVQSLDDDRVLRRLAALVQSITRTNYYQRDAEGSAKPYISFKIASRDLNDLPAPKPYREIFVASPVVEGVHLRFGPVARGGLRWSDRRDDFRTEVLGLVKAQQVKNAVIVPVGSKGGFYPRLLPRYATPREVQEAAIGAYKMFLRGLLDLTDNIAAGGQILHPAGVVVHDAEDPYLVVAADKGTATFSDIANSVAAEYGFWLGDAFASGGSAGFDHKAMGITARGAWESVKRHFREMGRDIQNQPTSLVGVGDMSGDVFGNGLLLSKAVRLVAAFDHRHIFIDPNPDPEASWAERERLFKLPTSSWDDYDRTLLSDGGGVWPRSQKSIPLSPQARAALDIAAEEAAPSEIMRAILKARVDLLYLGGIGTYVKATSQNHLDVGDKANDEIRVNGAELRCKVVGEGANLGLTQAGRIEYALTGGRIDTDAIDNSAGVDTSDHEVNIKILASLAEHSGRLPAAKRNPLLAAMTEDVGLHVLSHNYDQTLALSLLEASAPADLDAQIQFMVDLESRGRLDRRLEGLPDAETLAERAKVNRGLTRPELAVLLAYGKLEAFDELVASKGPDDAWFATTLQRYFPNLMSDFSEEMTQHRLRREIIATTLANDLVNLCGPTFADRLKTSAGCDTSTLIFAFEAARESLRFAEIWREVAALDGQIPAVAQTDLFRELVQVLRGLTFGLARRGGHKDVGVAALVETCRPAIDALKPLVPSALSSVEAKAAVRRGASWIKRGAPRALAHQIALMRCLTSAPYLSELAEEVSWPLPNAAFVYYRVGGQFAFDKLRAAATTRSKGDRFERLATRRLVEDMLAEQGALAAAIMRFAGKASPDPAVDAGAVAIWAAAHGPRVRTAKKSLEEIERSGGDWSFAKLTIANAVLRDLARG